MRMRPRYRTLGVAVLLAAWLLLCPHDGLAQQLPWEITDAIAAWQHHPTGTELSVEDLTLDPNRRTRRHVSREEAATDVRRFFHLLEFGYCGWGYFAREHDFDAARDSILADLRAREHWSTRDFTALVRQRLAFVEDGHLRLGKVRFTEHQDFWFVPKVDVVEREGVFRLGNDPSGARIVAVNGEDPRLHAFRSLDPEGQPTAVLGVLASENPEALRLDVETKEGVTPRSLALERSTRSRRQLFRVFRLGGIPVVRIGTFSDHHVEEVEAFLRTADELRDEPCVVVDLRGNGGGNTHWPREWIHRFTGQSPQLYQVLSELVSRTALVGQSNYMAWLAAGPGRDIRDWLEEERDRLAARIELLDRVGERPYWQPPHVPTCPPIPNDVTLVVVIDAAVASSGEGFLSYLHEQVENVVLVGENTRGAVTFGHMTVHRLPESGLLAFFPVKLNYPLDGVVREARGFEPDYWVPAEDALNRAVAALRAGTIPTVRPLPAAVLGAEFVRESPHRFRRERVRRLVPLVAMFVAGSMLATSLWARRRTLK